MSCLGSVLGQRSRRPAGWRIWAWAVAACLGGGAGLVPVRGTGLSRD